jgi:alkanesulfonate monooxygenase SsuD/methylene tetrahydromethanopterin reductase-like flavin-dependent oxidoreductase (luciferase family)
MSWQVLSELEPKVGLFLQIDGPSEVVAVYEQALELIVAAEALGFHSARVTQHHFGERNGWLPSPLPFLAAAGQRTRRIKLGTVVVTIPLENPFRLAEDAAVTDLLLNGRLELGLGSGLGPEVFATLGVDFESRREQTWEGIEQLLKALRGETLHERGAHLQPPDAALAERLWFAVMSEAGARYAARHNLGLLLGRVEHGGGSPVANQARTTQIYREALGPRAQLARIAAGRTIYVAEDREIAQRDLAEALKPLIAAYGRGGGLIPANAPLSEVLARLHILHGHPEEIAQTLAAEQAAIGWTELLVQVDVGNLPHHKALRNLERIAQEVIPRLGGSTIAPPLGAQTVQV